MNVKIAEPIGRAIGAERTGKTVVVGGDVRLSTRPLKEALTDRSVATGCHVLDVGIVPPPAFYFAKDHFEAGDGATAWCSWGRGGGSSKAA